MKRLSRIAVGALLVAGSIGSAFAQTAQPTNSGGPKTRAQVVAELAEWRAAGYDPLDWIDYPQNAQRAGQIVAARHAQQSGATLTQ